MLLRGKAELIPDEMTPACKSSLQAAFLASESVAVMAGPHMKIAQISKAKKMVGISTEGISILTLIEKILMTVEKQNFVQGILVYFLLEKKSSKLLSELIR